MIDRYMTTCPIHNEQHEAGWPCLQCEDEIILEFTGRFIRIDFKSEEQNHEN